MMRLITPGVLQGMIQHLLHRSAFILLPFRSSWDRETGRDGEGPNGSHRVVHESIGKGVLAYLKVHGTY